MSSSPVAIALVRWILYLFGASESEISSSSFSSRCRVSARDYAGIAQWAPLLLGQSGSIS